MPSYPLAVGFDLDMTLIDTRPGIKAAYLALSAETGTPIDADLAVSRLGPPVEEELRNWFPADVVAATADRYREIYPTHAIAPSLALPGARESVEAIRGRGGRTIVVTAKHRPSAELRAWPDVPPRHAAPCVPRPIRVADGRIFICIKGKVAMATHFNPVARWIGHAALPWGCDGRDELPEWSGDRASLRRRSGRWRPGGAVDRTTMFAVGKGGGEAGPGPAMPATARRQRSGPCEPGPRTPFVSRWS